MQKALCFSAPQQLKSHPRNIKQVISASSIRQMRMVLQCVFAFSKKMDFFDAATQLLLPREKKSNSGFSEETFLAIWLLDTRQKHADMLLLASFSAAVFSCAVDQSQVRYGAFPKFSMNASRDRSTLRCMPSMPKEEEEKQ